MPILIDDRPPGDPSSAEKTIPKNPLQVVLDQPEIQRGARDEKHGDAQARAMTSAR
jgi:hypothetical protein